MKLIAIASGLIVLTLAGCSGDGNDGNGASGGVGGNGPESVRPEDSIHPQMVVASHQAMPSAITVLGPDIYYLVAGGILRFTTKDGTWNRDVGGADAYFRQITYNNLVNDGESVYWTSRDSSKVGYLTLNSRDGLLKGGASGGAFGDGAPEGGATGITVCGGYVFWVNEATGSVLQVPTHHRFDPPASFYTGRKGRVSLACDGQSVYVANADAEAIEQIPIDGSRGPKTIASNRHGLEGIVADATGVYWTERSSLNVMKIAAGSDTLVTVANGVVQPFAIALDETDVYWADRNDIFRAPKHGGVPTRLLYVRMSDAMLTGIAVDATHVYWTSTDGTVMKMQK